MVASTRSAAIIGRPVQQQHCPRQTRLCRPEAIGHAPPLKEYRYEAKVRGVQPSTAVHRTLDLDARLQSSTKTALAPETPNSTTNGTAAPVNGATHTGTCRQVHRNRGFQACSEAPNLSASTPANEPAVVVRPNDPEPRNDGVCVEHVSAKLKLGLAGHL